MSSSPGRFGLPSREEIYQSVSSFSVKQKIIFLVILIVFTLSGLGILWQVNNFFIVDVAVPGGSLTEGVIGAPSHINPLLAVTDADRDLSMLVYSGLLRPGTNSELILDLAKSYEVSPDGLTYIFKLRSALTWQDGQPLTSGDVAFTIEKAQDPSIKSPKRANWEGVRVVINGPDEIKFILKKPYASFLENATLGILPKHLWVNLKSEAWSLSDYNIKPIGSGPYKVSKVTKSAAGLPLAYNLSPFDKFALWSPKITNLTLRFYGNEEDLKTAYERGEVESLGAISPALALSLEARGATITEIFLPRIFAVFFNQGGTPALNDLSVRQALDLATNRQAIVKDIMKNKAVMIDNPIPPGSLGYLKKDSEPPFDLEKAKQLLETNGWIIGSDNIRQKTNKKNTVKLEFSLAVPNVSELKAIANLLQNNWQKIGARVTVNVFELGDLDQNVIRPRKFDTLVFGEIIGRNPDLYSFWHSSQRYWPGLNIAGYANVEADKKLENIRQTIDPTDGQAKYEKFQTELKKDRPAIFLYSPYFLYVMPDKIQGAEFPSLVTQAERFASVYKWYINQERVWKIFANYHSPAE
ncbi:MAG: peptide ABC transporter substrate-binding protein [Patescibacteria group bacterium]